MAANFVCRTRDPKNPEQGTADAIFPGAYTERLYKVAQVQYLNLVAAKFVLENVERIFFGVREYNEGGWCYTARPEQWHIRADVVVPFPPDKVFAVYLNPLMYVYECRAEFAADDDATCPINWRDRYRGLIWKRTS